MSSAAPARKKSVKVKLKDIMVDAYVREKTDPEYVFHLATLYEAGVAVEPIEVTKSLHLIEGRHRVEAANLAGLEEIDAIIYPDMPLKERLAMAMVANIGGKRAPTKADILVGMEAMVKAGASERYIRDQIAMLPKSVLDTYLGEVRGAIQRQKIAQARALLADGKTIEQAASEVGLTVASIQERLLRVRVSTHSPIEHVDRSMVRRNRQSGQTNRMLFDAAMKSVLDGDITKEKALDVADLVERHGKLSISAAEDFRKRLIQRLS